MSNARRAGTTIACVALAATAACSSGASKATPHTNPGQPAIAPTPTSASYVAQVKARARATAAYAEQLAGRAPELPGERPFTATPPRNLRKANETIGISNLVVRSRYWTSPDSPHAVYLALKHATPTGLRLTGYGDPAISGDDAPGRGFVHFDPTSRPSFIEGDELYVEMEPSGHGGTVIAAFGEAYAHPVRFAAEHISPSGSTVTAKWPQLAHGKVVAHPSETPSQSQAQAVIRGFNQSGVASPSTCLGPFRLAGDVLTIVIRSAGHAWTLTYPGTSCEGLGVTRDGVQFPALDPDPAYLHLLRVLSHSGGYAVGHLLVVGGPSPGPPRGISGTASLLQGGQLVDTTHTRNAQGYFLLSAQPGSYTLSGSSIHFTVNGKPGKCAATHPVVIRTDEKTHADIYCQLR